MSKKFKQLLVPEGYRHYWSKYPEGYTILEALLNWVDSVNQLTENVNDWNIYLDDFVETFDEKLRSTVRELLNEMETDGTLAEIINEEIFSWKADKIYVDQQIANVASGSPKGGYETLTELETDLPNGDTGIYVAADSGNWYFWDGANWVAGGLYQSNEWLGLITEENEDWVVE